MITRERVGRVYIYIVFVLWAGLEVFISSMLKNILWWKKEVIDDHMAIITLVLLAVYIFLIQKYDLKEIIIIGMISLPIIMATLNSRHNVMMSTWIFIVAMKYVDFDKFAKIFYYVELPCTLFVIVLFKMGYIGEYTIYSHSVLRHSYGFTHPNMLGIRVFLLVICRCYLRRQKFNFIDWSIIIAASIYVNKVSNSKTAYYALIILAVIMAAYLIVLLFGKNISVLSDLMIIIAAGSVLMSVGMSMINCRKYPILGAIDRLMSFRFSKSYATKSYYGVKLFGQRVRLIFSNPGTGKTYHFWMDNAYMSILLRYGVVVFIIITSLYIWTMIYLKNKNQHVLVALLCLYSIYGIMENSFFYISQNIFLLLLAYPIYSRDSAFDASETLQSRIRLSW